MFVGVCVACECNELLWIMNAIFLRSAANGLMLERERERGAREKRESGQRRIRDRETVVRGVMFLGMLFLTFTE